MQLYLSRNLSEPGIPKALVLSGVPVNETTESVTAVVEWRWEDEPDMKAEPLGEAVAGNSLVVPFDLKGRSVRLFLNSKTKDGEAAFSDIAKTVQTVFTAPLLPILANAEFDSGTDEVTLTIAENGLLGDIHIFRQIDAEGFFEIDSVSAATTSYIDEPEIDGDYQYKLTQDGAEGESNTKTVAVNVGDAGTGLPPVGLTAVYDDIDTTDLNWTNNGGTGDVVVERRIDAGAYSVLVTLASSAVSYSDSTPPGPAAHIYYYRVRNTSAVGYSDEAEVYVPRE